MEIIKRNFTKRTTHEQTTLLKNIESIEKNHNEKKETNSNEASSRKKANETIFYATRAIQRRVDDISRVNVFYDLVDNKYDVLCLNQCAKEAIITPLAIKDITNTFPILKTYPDLILDLATIFPDPPPSIKQAIDSNQLWNPQPSLYENAFKYDSDNKQATDIKYKYLVNMQGRLLRSYLNNRKSASFNQKINSEIFLQLSNQSRWNNLWIQIAASFFYIDTVSPAKALQNLGYDFSDIRRKATQLITLQSIAYILKRFSVLPFRVRRDGKLDISYCDQDWGLSIIPLLYSLLELSKEEKGCNINEDFLIPVIEYRVKSAYTSFESETLAKKSIYPSMIKIPTSKITKYARRSYDQTMQSQRIELFDQNNEVFTDQLEMNRLNDKVKNSAYINFTTVFNKYMKTINSGTHTQNTERMRWLAMILLIMGNTGLYYKTSLLLEREEAVGSKTLGTLNFPKPSKYWIFNDMKIELQTDWTSGNSTFFEISQRYKRAVKKYLPSLNDSLQEWFYMLLSNKSQGFKVNIDNFASSLNISEELLSELRNVSQVRVASFLLDNQVYSVFVEFFEALQRDGVCTIRYSNNRKGRFIEMVPNVDQTAYALILKIFEQMKTDSEEIAVGKQIGGIVDMSLQLRISGLDNAISIFSDVAGMDAHTQPNVAVMFLKMLSDLIIEDNVGPTNYFPFRTSLCQTQIEKDTLLHELRGEHQPMTDENYRPEVIPALAQALLFIASQRLNKKYGYKDTIFSTIIDINPSIFESGRYDTGAQHSTLLMFLAELVYESLFQVKPEFIGWLRSYIRKFGDDSYEAIEFNALTKKQQQEVLEHILQATEQVLYDVGLKADSEVSSYYGDFLQQMALCGVCVPKSARSTIFTDESNALIQRDMIDLISNLSNIITASAQRSYAPENITSIVRNIWAINRTFRILSSKSTTLAPSLRPFVKHYGGNPYLEYPYILISVPPLNFPNQTFVFENGSILPASSHIRTVGHCKLNYIWNEMISIDVREQLLSIKETSTIARVLDPVAVFIDQTRGTGIYESLIFQSYNRSQELSDMRFTKLAEPIIQMGKIAAKYFNSEKLKMSAAAAYMLKDTYNITMPDALLYYMKPIEQLKNMFETRAETNDEAMGLNDAYIRFMNKSFRVIQTPIKDMITNTCIFWVESNIAIDNTYIEYPELPLMPGYNKESDYYRAQMLVGNSFINMQRHNKALTTFSSRYGNAYNLEAIHRIGMKAKNADLGQTNKAFDLFMSAMQLPDHVRHAVEEMFLNLETVIMPDMYASGFQPEQNFALSDSISNIRNFIHSELIRTRTALETLTVILRDYLFMNAHRPTYSCKYTPMMPAVTFVKYGLRNILRDIGIKGV